MTMGTGEGTLTLCLFVNLEAVAGGFQDIDALLGVEGLLTRIRFEFGGELY